MHDCVWMLHMLLWRTVSCGAHFSSSLVRGRCDAAQPFTQGGLLCGVDVSWHRRCCRGLGAL